MLSALFYPIPFCIFDPFSYHFVCLFACLLYSVLLTACNTLLAEGCIVMVVFLSPGVIFFAISFSELFCTGRHIYVIFSFFCYHHHPYPGMSRRSAIFRFTCPALVCLKTTMAVTTLTRAIPYLPAECGLQKNRWKSAAPLGCIYPSLSWLKTP